MGITETAYTVAWREYHTRAPRGRHVCGFSHGPSGDVADPNYCKAAVARTVKEFGKLDILVNNAAFQQHVNKFEDLTEEHFDLTIKTNLYGYFYMAKAALREMKNGSSIVMTGSVTGLLGSSITR